MIQLNEEFFENITSDKLDFLDGLIKPYLNHKQQLYNRYSRKANTNDTMGAYTDRIIVAFEYYIVNMAKGYLAGLEPKYTVKDSDNMESYQESIDFIRRYNDDAATFIELMHDYLITTSAYLYIYENEENEIVYTRFDSLQTVVIYDYGTPPYPVASVRKWIESDPNGTKIEVMEIVTKNERVTYKNGNKHGESEIMLWGDIPITSFENPDGIAIFEPALDKIDAYENLVTNIKSMTQYNDTAKLMLRGYMFMSPDMESEDRRKEEERIYKSKCLQVDADGDVKWLLKNIDYGGILDVLKQLHDLITMLTGVPNMTDQAFSNADNASALGYKLYALDQYSATADRVFKKGYLRLWEIITNRLNLKGNSYNFRDIDIAFNRNIPTDKDKSIDRAVKALNSQLISLETAINISGIEVDADSEIERIRAERQDDYTTIQNKHVEDVVDDEKPILEIS